MKASRPSIIDTTADWIAPLEIMSETSAPDDVWRRDLVAALRPLFPRDSLLGTYTLEHTADLTSMRTSAGYPDAVAAFIGELEAIAQSVGTPAWAPIHFGSPVMHASDALGASAPEISTRIFASAANRGHGDSIGLVAHPRPGTVFVVTAMFENRLTLSRHERELVTRLAMHLEAGVRLRLAPETVLAEVTPAGRVERHESRAPSTEAVSRSVLDVDAARSMSNGRGPRATSLWRALVEGEASIVPSRGVYFVLENRAQSKHLRALLPPEEQVLSLAARGMSNKSIAYALGLAPSVVSTHFTRAAHKLGLLNRVELLRVAAMLTDGSRVGLPEDLLTAAEKEILELLERGLSNAQIAMNRQRSVRTVANQVAALLRKTGSPSRRALALRAPQRRRDP